MLETLNMVLVCCPVGFSEEIMAVFGLKKVSCRLRKRLKSKKFPFFNVFTHLVKFWTDFVDWNVLGDQQGQGWLSSNHFGIVFCIFLNENVLN